MATTSCKTYTSGLGLQSSRLDSGPSSSPQLRLKEVTRERVLFDVLLRPDAEGARAVRIGILPGRGDLGVIGVGQKGTR